MINILDDLEKLQKRVKAMHEAATADEKLPTFAELRHRGASHVSAGGRTYKVTVEDVTEKVTKKVRK